MRLVEGGKTSLIVGCKAGELIWVHLITGIAERVILSTVDRNGIEGFQADIKDQPLTFYPFTNIIKVKKYSEIK